MQSDSDSAKLAWHALGSVHPQTTACPVCGAADTWKNRQGPAFRTLVAEIDTCASLAELGVVGKRLYGLRLHRDQASVAWSHFRVRRAALEAAVTPGAEARRLLAEVERASARTLPRVGAALYRIQRAGTPAIAGAEWRLIWHAYAARRRARVA